MILLVSFLPNSPLFRPICTVVLHLGYTWNYYIYRRWVSLIAKLSYRFANRLSNADIISDSQKEVVAYGFELLVSTLINLLSVLLISIVLHNLVGGLLFLAAFIPIRTYAGGYHAKSHFRCALIFCIAFSLCIAIPKLIPEIIQPYIPLSFSLLSFIAILLWSPSDSPEKPLDAEDRAKYRKISLYISLFNLLFAVFSCHCVSSIPILNYYFFGVFAAAISLAVVHKIKQRRTES